MKNKIFTSIAVLLSAMLLASCSSTRLISSWAGTVPSNTMDKVLVFSLLSKSDNKLQDNFEDAIVANLNAHGAKSFSAFDIFGPDALKKQQKEDIAKAIRDGGYTGVLLITLLDKEQNEEYTPPTTTIMIRQEDEYDMVIQAPGHFFFDTIVSIPDGYDQQLCDVQLKPIQKNMVVQLKNIQFEPNSYMLTRSSFIELEKVFQLLEANPELHIELSAHTDDIGTDEYNDRLSAKRGEATLEFLVKKGIDRNRLTSIGYGKRQPLVPNDSDEHRAMNRRVEFKVTEF